MNTEIIQLSRQELYQKVWATPLIKLAEEFGISDRGLAKLCKRNKIPLPGIGHWSKIKAGVKIEHKVLPSIKEEVSTKSIIFKRNINPDISLPVITEIENVIIEEKANNYSTPLEESNTFSHHIALNLQKLISSKSDERGCLLAKKGYLKTLSVTQQTLARSLNVLDKFIIFVKTKGLKVNLIKDQHIEVELFIYSERFLVRIIEEIKSNKPSRIRASDMSNQEYYEYIKTKWIYKPTGKLKLEVKGEYSRNTISDTVKIPVENRFQTLLINLYEATKKVKSIREELVQRQRILHEQHQKWREEQSLREQYNKRVELIQTTQIKWHQTEQINQFYIALQSHLKVIECQATKEKIQGVLCWIKYYLQTNNPLNNLDDLIQKFEAG